MQRRAMYMYGIALPVDEKGYVDSGLGTTSSFGGSSSLIAPPITIQKTGERLNIDGVMMEFQITPDTEAPAEMNVWFPDKKALCLAENCVGTFHNIPTIRGAEVRNPLAWSNYLDEALRRYGSDAEGYCSPLTTGPDSGTRMLLPSLKTNATCTNTFMIRRFIP